MPVTKPKRDKLFRECRGLCFYCGRQTHLPVMEGLVFKHSPETFSVDHKTPKSKGGKDDASNLVGSCWNCNSSKRALTIDEYRVAIVRRQGGLFTEMQIKYWEERGVKLPVPSSADYPVFFGER